MFSSSNNDSTDGVLRINEVLELQEQLNEIYENINIEEAAIESSEKNIQHEEKQIALAKVNLDSLAVLAEEVNQKIQDIKKQVNAEIDHTVNSLDEIINMDLETQIKDSQKISSTSLINENINQASAEKKNEPIKRKILEVNTNQTNVSIKKQNVSSAKKLIRQTSEPKIRNIHFPRMISAPSSNSHDPYSVNSANNTPTNTSSNNFNFNFTTSPSSSITSANNFHSYLHTSTDLLHSKCHGVYEEISLVPILQFKRKTSKGSVYPERKFSKVVALNVEGILINDKNEIQNEANLINFLTNLPNAHRTSVILITDRKSHGLELNKQAPNTVYALVEKLRHASKATLPIREFYYPLQDPMRIGSFKFNKWKTELLHDLCHTHGIQPNDILFIDSNEQYVECAHKEGLNFAIQIEQQADFTKDDNVIKWLTLENQLRMNP